MMLSDMTATERRVASEWVDGLLSAQSLAGVQEVSERSFSRLFRADASAICLSLREDPTRYEWRTQTPASLLRDYATWAHEDFVLTSVRKHLNVPLSDADMLQGRKVEDTFTYRLSRERGLRFKHVLAVSITRPGESWLGGVTLYGERAPFVARSRQLLDWVRPRVENSFWNIQRFADAHRGHLLELVTGQECAVLVLDPFGREEYRTPAAEHLLARWFGPSDRGAAGVPLAFTQRLELLVRRQGQASPGAHRLELTGPEATLGVEFNPLPPVNQRHYWELKMHEIPHPLPKEWRERLSEREADIATHLLQGGQNEDIAEAAGCSVGTVKKHLSRIYRKVGADGRADFISRALTK